MTSIHVEKGNRRSRSRAAGLLATTALLTLAVTMQTGCGIAGGNTSSSPVSVTGAAMRGSVHGGQQPVSGARIQLYAAGASGYASAATSLIASTVLSNPDGSFAITSTYTCPSPSTLVYITATGGNSGSGTNANLAMMAALGPCGNLTPTTFIAINELTTVGSVWALAPFMSGPTTLGASAANSGGLSNAFADVNTLVSISTGTTPGLAVPAGATVPVAEINTLADILASCINSAGGSSTSSTPCGNLFTAATPAGGSAPADTITAAVDIAKNPGHNVGTLYSSVMATAPFQPTLSTVPNDFTIAVNFTGGNFASPAGLAADAAGNVWVANAGNNSVTELSHAGTVLSGTGYTAGLNLPSAIAVAADGTVWVTNKGNNTVDRLTSSGTLSSGAPYTGGGLNLPSSIAFDSLGNAWVSNGGSTSVTSISSTGTVAGYTPAGVASPVAIGVTPH